MSYPNYSLEVVSHHPQFNGKSLRQYYVDGINTIGAWGDEPFSVVFKNNTWQKVQVKLTLDGTDILTGKPADTSPSDKMWVVNPFSSMTLKAFPEDNNGGAAFVFTSANNSVAVHTHGDLSSRGIIAAAVFTEGHVAPYVNLTYPVIYNNQYHYDWNTSPYLTCQSVWLNNNVSTIIPTSSSGGGGTFGSSVGNLSYNSSNYLGSRQINETAEEKCSASFDQLVAIGAGQHVDQKITHVQGLIKPILSETVRVRYLWWDDLVAKLRTQTAAQPQPSGFPADHNHKNIDLKCTPRLGEKKGSFQRATENYQPVFDRF